MNQLNPLAIVGFVCLTGAFVTGLVAVDDRRRPGGVAAPAARRVRLALIVALVLLGLAALAGPATAADPCEAARTGGPLPTDARELVAYSVCARLYGRHEAGQRAGLAAFDSLGDKYPLALPPHMRRPAWSPQ